MVSALDYSWARPDPKAMRAAGYVAVIRYLSGGGGKDLTRPELAALQAAGLGIGLVWETSANRMDGGYGAGGADGQAARAQARGLGFPDALPLYFANDQNRFTGAHLDYMRGAHDAAGLVGPYGNTALIDTCTAQLGLRYGWHVETWGPQTPNACLIQLANFHGPIPGTDDNLITRADCGLWGYGSTSASPIPPTTGDEMAFGYCDNGNWYLFNGGGADVIDAELAFNLASGGKMASLSSEGHPIPALRVVRYNLDHGRNADGTAKADTA